MMKTQQTYGRIINNCYNKSHQQNICKLEDKWKLKNKIKRISMRELKSYLATSWIKKNNKTMMMKKNCNKNQNQKKIRRMMKKASKTRMNKLMKKNKEKINKKW